MKKEKNVLRRASSKVFHSSTSPKKAQAPLLYQQNRGISSNQNKLNRFWIMLRIRVHV